MALRRKVNTPSWNHGKPLAGWIETVMLHLSLKALNGSLHFTIGGRHFLSFRYAASKNKCGASGVSRQPSDAGVRRSRVALAFPSTDIPFTGSGMSPTYVAFTPSKLTLHSRHQMATTTPKQISIPYWQILCKPGDTPLLLFRN